jgi:hypothetical protein
LFHRHFPYNLATITLRISREDYFLNSFQQKFISSLSIFCDVRFIHKS